MAKQKDSKKQKSARLRKELIKARVEPKSPMGVLDIGSNSIRLVGYSGTARTPTPIYNERAFCRLGEAVAETGHIEGTPYMLAMTSLKRFRAIADQLGIDNITAFATAAVRNAKNQKDIIKEMEEILRGPVEILTGTQEAQLSADGVVLSVTQKTGLVADLGGGSLELALVDNGKILNADSFPLGVLTLAKAHNQNIDKINKQLQKTLAKINWLKKAKNLPLFTVGGTWRSLARLHMIDHNYGLDVLHQYEIPRKGLKSFTKKIITQKDPHLLMQANSHRRKTLPIAALVLETLRDYARPSEIIVSATGVREGVLYTRMAPEFRKLDGLRTTCEEMSDRLSKAPAYGRELIKWTEHILANEKEQKKWEPYRKAACLLSDISWSVHPSARAEIASLTVLKAPLVSITHEGRMMVACALAYRHEVKTGMDFMKTVPLTKDIIRIGRILGLSFRLAHSLSGSLPGLIQESKLEISKTKIRLNVKNIPDALNAPIIENRLQKLANALELSYEIIS